MSSCSPSKPAFKSDKKMKYFFQNRKLELISVLKKCQLEKEEGEMKFHIKGSYDVCKINPTQLKKINTLEVATEVIRNNPKRRYIELAKNNSFIFVTDQYIDSRFGTYVEEKGYIFSANPLKQDVITTGSLDEFRNIEIDRKSEKWKYKLIEPNWYLYYRRYHHEYP